jgi:kinesin family member 1
MRGKRPAAPASSSSPSHWLTVLALCLCSEIEKKSKICIAMPSKEQTSITQPETDAPKMFTFDFSYWSHDGFKKDEKTGCSVADGPDSKYASQQTVYEDLGKIVLDNAFDGYNCSLFAYGQTGSGKSYSMVGYGVDKGIIPLACEQLFKRVDDSRGKDPNVSYQITVTMLEIYNEQVRDLLTSKPPPNGGLKLREKKGIGVYVEGLGNRPVANYAEIEARMDEGSRNRTIGSTKMNATSSRAHTVFGILFTKKAKDPASGIEAETTSKINLVDLAGSERADSTGATGDRLKEGCAINQSLSALVRHWHCLCALAAVG